MEVIENLQACMAKAMEADPVYKTCIMSSGLYNINGDGTCSSPCTSANDDGSLPEKCCSVLDKVAECSSVSGAECTKFIASLSGDGYACPTSTMWIITAILFMVLAGVLSGVVVMYRRHGNSGLPPSNWFMMEISQVANLMWKNLKLRLRFKRSLFFDLMVPLLIVFLLVFIMNYDLWFGYSYYYPNRDEKDTGVANSCEELNFAKRKSSFGMNSASDGLDYVLGILFVIAYLKMVSAWTAALMVEKESKAKDGLRMMGVKDRSVLIAWYLTSFVLYIPIAILNAVQLVLGNIISGASIFQVFLLLFCFQCAIISYCYMISPFFNKSKTATVLSSFIWVVTMLPYFFHESMSTSVQYLASFLPTTALSFALQNLLKRTVYGTGIGISISNWGSERNALTAESMTLMLLFDAVLIFVLGWYFDKVVPQQFGVPLPWNFFAFKSYWMPKTTFENADYQAMDAEMESPTTTLDAMAFEPTSAVLASQVQNNQCVSIKGLRKVFGNANSGHVALEKLNLDMFSGQITSLLGHNGAGKTTLISMLTGLIAPTSGNATVFGRSITKEMSSIQQIIGVCPQHDVLYNELSVWDHLCFYATIKGVVKANLESTVEAMIQEVGLKEKEHDASKILSGGQKRKLSVAIALIGGSKVVFLDEPTSGMDPYSRRFIWDLLRKHRKDRVIVLTTHFMDEADVLGDKIAILSDGILQCTGSSLFLKNRYGAGYNLTCVKSASCNVAALSTAVASIIPAATILSDASLEVIFQIPMEDCDSIPELLSYLDEHLVELHVEEYGISLTTLEAVFLRIANDRTASNNLDDVTRKQDTALNNGETSSVYTISAWRQFKAMLQKRYRYAKRDKKGILFTIVIPLLFLIVVLLYQQLVVGNVLPDEYYHNHQPAGYIDECNTKIATDPIAQQCAFQMEKSDANCTKVCNTFFSCEDDGELCRTTDTESFGRRFRKNETRPINALICPSFDPKPTPFSIETCKTAYFGHCALGFGKCDADVCCDQRREESPYASCRKCLNFPCLSKSCPQKSDVASQMLITNFLASLILSLGFCFIPAAIIVHVVKEKHLVQNAKFQQLISGAGIIPYWASHYAWDFMVLLVPSCCAMIVLSFFVGFQNDLEAIFGAFLVFVLYATSMIPLTYILSSRYIVHSKAQTAMLVFSMFSGVILSIISFVCRLIVYGSPQSALATFNRIAQNFYLLFPGYALFSGISRISMRKVNAKLGENASDTCFGKSMCWEKNVPGCCNPSVFEFNVAGKIIMYLVLESMVYAAILWYIEHRASQPKPSSKEVLTPAEQNAADDATTNEEADVHQERKLLKQDVPAEANIVMDGLTKIYPTDSKSKNILSKKVALHSLSLSIPRGECFGYLGKNGSGKTSTLKILTGLTAPSYGNATIGGYNVSTEQSKARKLIGYCPQFDSLLDLLTVAEHLELYAKIKGIPSRNVSSAVDTKIKEFDLNIYRNILSKNLSGGNKRKLCAAISLLGNPQVIFLDEPSTGMDPFARRKMWDVIANVTKSGNSSVVLTTHSMEECQALCSRVGILVAGRLTCLGSIQHLKTKYGKGYFIDARLRAASDSEIEIFRSSVLAKLSNNASSTQDNENISSHEAVTFEVDEANLRVYFENDPYRLEKVLSCQDSALALGEYFMDGKPFIPLNVFAAWLVSEFNEVRLAQFITTKFPNAVRIDSAEDSLSFSIPADGTQLSTLFRALHSHKAELGIQEYSVSDTSLEQVFNNFARQDIEIID